MIYTKNPILRTAKRVKNFLLKSRFRFLSTAVQSGEGVLFLSFGGRQYFDNPRAISLALHLARPDIRQTWILNEPDRFEDLVPGYVRVLGNSRSTLAQELAAAKVWVSNFELPSWVTKRNDQLYIQTYHGDRALKKVLYDATPRRDLHLMEERYCDYMVVGSLYAEKWIPRAFKYHGDLLKVGCPRNDKLLTLSDAEAHAIKSNLEVPLDAKILVYAPTFRDALKNAKQETFGLELSELLDVLQDG